MTGLRDRLRLATAAAHRELDGALLAGGLLDSSQGYLEFLRGWYRLQAGSERLLECSGVSQALCDWPQRRRAHLLAEDLDAMGAAIPDPDPFAATPLSRAALFGTLYVLEGATQGAGAVLRRLRRVGIATDANAAFLSHAVAHPQSWPAFVAVLDEQSGVTDPLEVIDAALNTFARAKACFVSSQAQAPTARHGRRPPSPGRRHTNAH